MTIDIALLELYNKVKDDPESTPEQIKAINKVVEWINDNKKSHLKNQKLFYKLYVIYFGYLCQHFKDINFAQKTIHKELSEPIPNHLHWLKEKVNSIVYDLWCKSKGMIVKDFISKEDELKNNEILKNNQESFLANTQKWSQEKINESMDNQISEAINSFYHYD